LLGFRKGAGENANLPLAYKNAGWKKSRSPNYKIPRTQSAGKFFAIVQQKL